MKESILTGIFGGFTCILMSFQAVAQQEVSIAKGNTDEGAANLFSVTNFVNSAPKNAMGTTVSPLSLGHKINKSFTTTFGERSNVSWTQLGKKTYLAQFDLDGRKTNALFYNSGYMEYSVSYGTEANIPKDVRRRIRSTYYDEDYTVGASFEIRFKDKENGNTMLDKKAWVVNLESEDNIKIVRVIDGSVDELADYQKKLPVRSRKGKVIIPKQ